jgi:hypothetical protein
MRKAHDGNRDGVLCESHCDYPARDREHVPGLHHRHSPLYDPDALDLVLKKSGNERQYVSKWPMGRR